MFASPTGGYMFTSSGFPFLNWGIYSSMNSFKMVGNFLAVLNFQPV